MNLFPVTSDQMPKAVEKYPSLVEGVKATSYRNRGESPAFGVSMSYTNPSVLYMDLDLEGISKENRQSLTDELKKSYSSNGQPNANLILSPWRRLIRFCWTTLFFACGTAAASAPVIRLNNDHALCGDFFSLLQSASVAAMTDEQLCAFRFSSLSGDTRGYFSFPNFQEFHPKDVAGEAMRVYDASAADHKKRDASRREDHLAIIRAATKEDNLRFYRGALQIPGARQPTYIETIDVSHCSKTAVTYRDTDASIKMAPYIYQGFPALGAFTDPAYAKEIDTDPSIFQSQIALYKNKTVVQISISPQWIRISPQAVLPVSLQVFQRMPPSHMLYGWVPETLQAKSMCEIEIKSMESIGERGNNR